METETKNQRQSVLVGALERVVTVQQRTAVWICHNGEPVCYLGSFDTQQGAEAKAARVIDALALALGEVIHRDEGLERAQDARPIEGQMTVDEISEKQQQVNVKYEIAKKIRALLDEARGVYGPKQWDEEDLEGEVLDLVREES